MIGQYPKIYDAIRELVGGSLAGETDSFESTQYLDGQTPPTKKQAEDKLVELQAEYHAKKYQRDRQPEYPNIGDQLDALYHAGVFPKEMADKLKAVKDKYPKPE
jgi:hypothetical protein